jgi:hypothetical protein
MSRFNMQAKANLPDECTLPSRDALSSEQLRTSNRLQNFRPLLFVVLLGIAAIVPAFFRGVPYGPDLPAHLRNTLSFNQSIQSGDLYQSWLAESNGGYGDPSMRLYPPILHYVFAFTHWVTGDWYSAVLFAFAILSVAGGLGVYFWARSYCSPRLAVFAGACYVFAPFHVNELYQSALLGQYAGGAALAFAFGFTDRVCRRGRMRDMAGLALSLAILIYTHIPLTMMAAIALPIYSLMVVDREKFLSTISKLALSALIAVTAGALYWTTLVAESGWVKGDTVDPGTRYNYALNFLFRSFSPEDSRNWWINIVAIAMALLIWPAFALWRRSSSNTKPLLVLVSFSFLMATPLSWPIWKVIPKLGSIEFPWRWLAIMSIAGTVAVAAALPFWLEKAQTKLRPVALLAAGSVLIALVFAMSHPIRGAMFQSRPQFDAMVESLPGTAGFEDGLPIWSNEKPRPMSQVVEADARAITIDSWQGEHRAFKIASGEVGDVTEARLRTFYHPFWRATVDGQPLATSPAADGALLIALPPNAVSVNLDFNEPRYVKLSGIASIVGLLVIAALFVFSFPRVGALFKARGKSSRIAIPPSQSPSIVEGV